MVEGYATPEGTKLFSESAIAKGVVPEHFRSFLGLTFSSIGVGTYLGEPDDETDKRVSSAITDSVSSGFSNVVDTAINYRFQKAERAVGRAIRHLIEKRVTTRDQVFVATKNGYLTHDGDLSLSYTQYIKQNLIDTGILRVQDIVGNIHCMMPSFLEHQLNQSINNLGLSTIDLVYLHNAAESQMPIIGRTEFFRRLRKAFAFYEDARRRGLIRFYGMASWTCFRSLPGDRVYLDLAGVVKLARDVGGEEHGFRFIQLPFNTVMLEAAVLENQLVDGELFTIFEAAQRVGVGVFTSAPLLEGELIHAGPDLSIPLPTRANRLIQLARSAPTLAALVGVKSPKHMAENSTLSKVKPLTEEEFREILARLA